MLRFWRDEGGMLGIGFSLTGSSTNDMSTGPSVGGGLLLSDGTGGFLLLASGDYLLFSS